MNRKKILVVLIGGALVGALTSAVTLFPNFTLILNAGSALITMIVAYINGANNKT